MSKNTMTTSNAKYGTVDLQPAEIVCLKVEKNCWNRLEPRVCWGFAISAILALAMVFAAAPSIGRHQDDIPILGQSLEGRTLILVRHAKSSWDDPGLEDFDRPLNSKGRHSAKRLGLYLRKTHETYPEIIFSSPSVRTRETLELIQQAPWATDVPVEFDRQLFGSDDYLNFVNQIDPRFNRVMLVGHNPAIGNLAKKLTAVGSVEKFPTGSYCEIRWSELSTGPDWSATKEAKGTLVIHAGGY
jgi:phosphohistidine phosphatase